MLGQLQLTSENVPYLNIFKSGSGDINDDGEYFKGIGKLYKINSTFQRGYGLQSGRFNHLKKRGTGIGSFFQSLWRVAFPMIKSSAKKLGSTALDVATNVAADVLQGRNIKESAKEHLTTKGTALLQDIKSKGVELLQNAAPDVSASINKNVKSGEVTSSSPTLAAPSPLRRIPTKRISTKAVYKIPSKIKKVKYPGLKYLT